MKTGTTTTEQAAGPSLVIGDLIARLEKATGPDRELDFDIAMLLNEPFGAWENFQKYNAAFPAYTRRDVAASTASIDAALTLLSDGVDWLQSRMTDPADGKPYFYASIGGESQVWYGATPAIALCIAALRARQ